MKFKFSNHAIEQIQTRRIPKEAVDQVLDNPDQIIDVNGKKIYQSIIVIENKKYLIRVFVNAIKIPNIIITVYKTSNIKKYYEN